MMDLTPEEWFALIGPGTTPSIVEDADTDVVDHHDIAPTDIALVLNLRHRPLAPTYRQAYRLSTKAAEVLAFKLMESIAQTRVPSTPAVPLVPWVDPYTIVRDETPYRCPQCGNAGGHTPACHTGTHHVIPPDPCTCGASDGR